jgi:hypothetical protein
LNAIASTTRSCGERTSIVPDEGQGFCGRLARPAPDEYETVRDLRGEHRGAVVGLFALWWAHARSESRGAQAPAEHVGDVLGSRERGDPDVSGHALLVGEVWNSSAAPGRAIEAPSVVGALQVAVLGDAAHGEW